MIRTMQMDTLEFDREECSEQRREVLTDLQLQEVRPQQRFRPPVSDINEFLARMHALDGKDF
ncbi:MAG: hypothetical protein HKL98_06800 [Burkholderiales bacterium]|nr:hypothetical protein [Burkholderiales bacterium]